MKEETMTLSELKEYIRDMPEDEILTLRFEEEDEHGRADRNEGRALFSDQPMSNPEAALDVMRRELSGYDREVLCVVNLNSRLQPINFHVVSVGDLSQSIAFIPNILKSGILSNAQSFMLLHLCEASHKCSNITESAFVKIACLKVFGMSTTLLVLSPTDST